VENTIYVPSQPLKPQLPMPYHIATARAKNNATLANPIIERLVGQYDRQRVQDFVRDICTGPTGDNTRITRNSFAIRTGAGGCADNTWQCAHTAVNDLVQELQQMFSGDTWVTVSTSSFRADMCSNVVLRMAGAGPNSAKIVVSGAHIDSRNTGSGAGATGVAPGADDNGSGSAVLLEMARIIGANKVRFDHSVHFLWFCGEEQGLLGSANLANAYANRGDDIVGMFNNDMIGYTSPQHGVTLSMMNRFATRELSEACMAFSAIYVPTLRSAFTNACCSDQQSFFNAGFPSAGIFETPTNSVVYPEYHRPGDTFNNGLINYDQVHLFGRANFACMMEYAQPMA